MLTLNAIKLLGASTLLVCGVGSVSAARRAQHGTGSSSANESYEIVRANGKVVTKSDGFGDGRELDAHGSGDRILVKRDGSLYSITDRATVDEALAVSRPIEELTSKLDKAGERMGADAAKVAQRAMSKLKLDIHIPAIDIHIPAIDLKDLESADRAGDKIDVQSREFELKMKEFNAKMEEFARKISAVAELQSKRSMDESGFAKQMEEFGREMGGMGKQMGDSGQQIGELGREVGAAAREIDGRMRSIIQKAFDKGLANRVR